MLRVGLTGGIGSGKSTASLHFTSLGAYVINADEEAKKSKYLKRIFVYSLKAQRAKDD